MVPSKLYDGLMRGLHNTIGITTPTPSARSRWVLIVWIVSTVIIVRSSMLALLVYVF